MADVEAAVIPWLHGELDVRVVTDTPANLADVVPLVRFLRVGGPSDDNNPRFALPTVAVDAFGADRAAAAALAGSVDVAIRETLPGLTVNGATVTRTQTVTGPHWVPWDDTALRRMTATYRLYVKF